ncbi:hypothetical protein B0H10DRAFT_2207319 [Mycena sp. CBHHK59/15]|nr:hypothetical protein B0H10DRAFT_2207319 [Mycena sp. CBHHK59/15]
MSLSSCAASRFRLMWPTFPIFLFSSRDAPHVATTHTGNSAVPSNLNDCDPRRRVRPIRVAPHRAHVNYADPPHHKRSPYCVTLFVLLVALRPLRTMCTEACVYAWSW